MRLIKRLFKKPIVWVIAILGVFYYLWKQQPGTWGKIVEKIPFLGKVMPPKA